MTPVELVIVLAIVAILASVALPSWNLQVQIARRADARNTLIFVQVEQEKYRADNGRYAPSMSALGLSTYNSTSRDYYNVSIVSSSTTAFVASAAKPLTGNSLVPPAPFGASFDDSMAASSASTCAVAIASAPISPFARAWSTSLFASCSPFVRSLSN